MDRLPPQPSNDGAVPDRPGAIPLLTPAGRQRLADVARPGMLCAFDFDGTLAPMAADPGQVSLPTQLRDQLVELQRHATVAVITGRSVADCRARLHFEPHYLIGNHGLEGLPDPHRQPQQAWLGLVAQWRSAIEAALPQQSELAGAWVEDKGWSLAVHYRAVPNRTEARRLLRPMLTALAPSARRIGGKCVFNLLPAEAHDKGDALQALQQMHPAATALYAGDDDTDEDAFELAGPQLLTVRVGARQGSHAETYLNERSELPEMVRELIQLMASRTAQEERAQEERPRHDSSSTGQLHT